MSMMNVTSANGSGMAFPVLRGSSAYEIAVRRGFSGTEEEWLKSLVGMNGANGADGADGKDGKDGTNGKDGATGKSAYQYAKEGGYTGTENDFRAKMAEETPVIKPLILDANLSDYYGGNSEAGDKALEAIKSGRQILVRVPNADGGNYTAIYCPIMMYQVPLNGMYLYLFYLRDEKQDLSALLGQPAGTVQMPTYGQFQMLLSKKYESNPLE